MRSSTLVVECMSCVWFMISGELDLWMWVLLLRNYCMMFLRGMEGFVWGFGGG